MISSSDMSEFSYYEQFQVKTYYRSWVGTVALSAVVCVGTVLFLFRSFGKLLGNNNTSWLLIDMYFLPPIHFVLYGMMIALDPSNHVDTLCLFGRIMMPLCAFVYCAFMFYKSFEEHFYLEMVFYVFLALVHVLVMLPEDMLGGKLFKPFLRRSEWEIEADRTAAIMRFRAKQEEQPIRQQQQQEE